MATYLQYQTEIDNYERDSAAIETYAHIHDLSWEEAKAELDQMLADSYADLYEIYRND